MIRSKRGRYFAGLCLALLLGSGCSDSGATTTTTSAPESNLEIFSWWTSGGESEALRDLLDVFTTHHAEVQVTNAAAEEPTTARQRLSDRMRRGEPPDTFQAIAGVDLLSWVEKGTMRPLEEMALENDWREVFPPELLEALSADGQLYGVPLNMERDNNLYFNKKLLDDRSLSPPTTLAEFYDVCATLQQEDLVPLAMPAAGWVLALVFYETLMPAILGGEFYRDYFRGKADLETNEFKELLEEFSAVLSCSNVTVSSSSWTVAADSLVANQAAMLVMGDWAKGYFQRGKDARGVDRKVWRPELDFGVVPALGSEGYFTFNAATFGLPTRAQHPLAALAFLQVLASPEAQVTFSIQKGSLPARIDADLSELDAMMQQTAADLEKARQGSNHLLPGYASLSSFEYQEEINPSLLVFAVGGERARELDPQNVPPGEAKVKANDLEYLQGKLRVTYSLLQD